MTTPERLRRRQRLESLGIAILAVALVVASLWFNGRQSELDKQQLAQQKCLSTYISVNSETSAIRSRLVERESETTRRFLLDATNVKTREDFQRVRREYAASLRKIDKARADNPIRPLPKGVCDR